MDISRLLHVLGTMYWWCVTAFCRGLWNIPTPLDQFLDSHIAQMHINIDALCEKRWLPKQHPGKKSRHMLYLLCHQGSLDTQQDSGYYLHHNTAKHGYSGFVKSTGEWNGTLVFSDESRFCLFLSDGRMRVCIDQVNVIFWSAFTHGTWAPPRASWCGGHQLQLVVRFGVSTG